MLTVYNISISFAMTHLFVKSHQEHTYEKTIQSIPILNI